MPYSIIGNHTLSRRPTKRPDNHRDNAAKILPDFFPGLSSRRGWLDGFAKTIQTVQVTFAVQI